MTNNLRTIEDVKPGRIYISRGLGLQTYEVLATDDTCIAVRIKGHSGQVTISAYSFYSFIRAAKVEQPE